MKLIVRHIFQNKSMPPVLLSKYLSLWVFNCLNPPYLSTFRFYRLELYASLARAVVRGSFPPAECLHELLSMYYKINRHVQPQPNFTWNRNLHLYYKDIDKSYLPGRLGEAVGLMLMEKLGFPLFVHVEDIRLTKKGNQKRPDFIFFDKTIRHGVALECKGSFSTSIGNLQAILIKGMVTQITSWLGNTLQVGKNKIINLTTGYGIATLVTQKDNGLIVYELPPNPQPTPQTMGQVDVCVIHYARWLKIMGFQQIANALMGSKSAKNNLYRQKVRFRAYTYRGREFVLPLGKKGGLGSWGSLFNGTERIVLGLDMKIFDALCTSAANKNIEVTDWTVHEPNGQSENALVPDDSSETEILVDSNLQNEIIETLSQIDSFRQQSESSDALAGDIEGVFVVLGDGAMVYSENNSNIKVLTFRSYIRIFPGSQNEDQKSLFGDIEPSKSSTRSKFWQDKDL